MRFFCCFLILLSVLSATVLAAEDDTASLPTLKTTVKSVAVFKNGLGFVFRSGETDLKDGWTVLEQMPQATLGSFWVGTDSKAGHIEQVVATKVKKDREVDPASISEILAANVGEKAAIVYSLGSAGEAKRIEGIIISAVDERKAEEASLPGYQTNYSYNNYNRATTGQVVVLKVNSSDYGTIAINKNNIISVELASDNLKCKTKQEINTAKIRIGGKTKSAEISVAYLEKGITWSPSYLVDLKDEKQAEITLEAVLINDVENLEDADVSFVVGYPSFLYADILSPMMLQQSVSNFVHSIMFSGADSTRYSGILSQSTAANTAHYTPQPSSPAPADSEFNYSASKPMSGEGNEDLFFYHQDHVNLKKGDRARFTVFTSSIPYEHVYQLDVPDSANINENGYSNGSSRDQEATEPQVWHALRLTNTVKQPWTTAPALALNNKMPLAQGMMKYTPAGGKTILKLTIAPDVQCKQEQIEVSRRKSDGYNTYDVTVDGKIHVTNWKDKPVKVIVTKSLVGTVLEAGQDGKTTKVVRRLNSLNPTSEIGWEFTLDPGKTQDLTYKYQVYFK